MLPLGAHKTQIQIATRIHCGCERSEPTTPSSDDIWRSVSVTHESTASIGSGGRAGGGFDELLLLHLQLGRKKVWGADQNQIDRGCQRCHSKTKSTHRDEIAPVIATLRYHPKKVTRYIMYFIGQEIDNVTEVTTSEGSGWQLSALKKPRGIPHGGYPIWVPAGPTQFLTAGFSLSIYLSPAWFVLQNLSDTARILC